MMSSMDLEQRCNVLRQDLKVWEKKFAAQNEGRKAGREDIKADADISQKYKEYNKLRVRLASKSAPRTPSKRTANRSSAHDVQRTPKAQSKEEISTPMKRKWEEGLENSADQVNELLSPEGPSFIGPTPQRDGIVLGLFDMLQAGTPSKKREILADVELNALQTPSRKVQEAPSEASLESRARGERTPLSTGKRFLLNQFVTPKKRKLDDERTPTSASRGFSTPAFLRRDNVLGAIDETEETTPRPAPWKRQGLGRSLSAMIQAMKKDEDDRLNEEAEIMREMEMEEAGIPITRKPRKPRKPEILVEDSQVQMPLGPDRGLDSEDEDEDDEQSALGPDGKPRRVWKKKGLKRQTRRVIMRPNFVKPKPQSTLQIQDDSEDEPPAIPETQVETGAQINNHDSDDEGSEYASDDSHTPKKRKSVQKKPNATKEMAGKEGVVKAAARKIKATANANYQRLKIKGKGGSGKGKFRKRR